MVLENFLIDVDVLWDRVGKELYEKPDARAGRVMRVRVVNRGVVEDLTGYTLNLGWRNPKDETKFGLDVFDVVDITKGIFELPYTSGMLSNYGVLIGTLQLIPPVGGAIESNNFVITVKRSGVDSEAIQSENSFTALEVALVQISGWNATIGGKVEDWETDMAATKQLYIDKMLEVESTYPPRLVSVEQQLADIELNKANLADLPSSAYVFKGSTTFALLPTTGNTLGDVRWTTDNLLNYAWTGTAWTPIGNGAFADGSVVTPKLADKATTIPKLNLETQHAILSKKLFNELEILPIEPKLGLFYQGNYSTASKYASVIDKFSVSADHILKFSKKYNFILRKFTTDTTNTAVFMSGSELLIPANPVDILYYSLEIYRYEDAWGTTYTQALVDEVKANFMIFKFSPKIKKRLVPNTISGLIDDGTNGNPQGTYTAATGWGVYDVTLEKGEMIYYDMWVLKGAQSLAKFNVDGTFKESLITTSAVVNTNIKGVYVATEEIEHLKFNHVFTTYPFKCYKIQPDDLKSPLFGKTINFIGDSYVANNTESIDKTWHYKLADKHQMTYNNYGINGNGIVGIRGGTTPMKDRFTAMANNADYIVVIGGENDANLLLDIEEFKTGLDSFIAGLVAKYPKGKICFFTPWNAAWSTRNYIQPYIDAMIERCDHWCVPIFDASKNAGLYSWAGPSYRGFFFQGAYDGAHLNEAGHNNFLAAGEAFLENL